MKYAKQLCCVLLAALLALMCAGCAGQAAKVEPKGKAYFAYFDSVSYVYSYAGDSAEEFEARSAEVSGVLEEYHQLFDIYHEYSGINNLCTVNRQAGGDPVEVDAKLVEFLLLARELYEQTQGEMNVMMGSVLKIWHDHRTAGESVPSAEVLRAANEHTSFDLLEIDAVNNTLRIADPEASIDVGALGKGYAVEKAAEYLRSAGAEGYVLNVGGNIRTIGTKPDGSGWVTGIRDPKGASERDFALKLNIADTACVTSGVYERYYTVDGVRYHHIIDRDTLHPAEGFASLTVITPDSALADALSTALFCMPYEEGSKLAGAMGVDVIWIFPDGEIRTTPGLANLIIKE